AASALTALEVVERGKTALDMRHLGGVHDKAVASVYEGFQQLAAPGRLAGPPEEGRQPGDDEWQHNAGQMLDSTRLGLDQNVFTITGGVYIGANVALDGISLLLWVGADGNGARRMLCRQGVDRLQQLLGVNALVSEDGQREHAIARDSVGGSGGDAGVCVAPEVIQLALNCVQPHGAQLRDLYM